jgi:inhibitor of KinA sporulation pathway (predicted exonuclease)
MQYIVLDLEWNQADTPEESVSDIPFEIVEIGAVKLNNDRKMVSEFSELVRPQVYSRMHGITQKLIHLQMEQLMSGKPFQDVFGQIQRVVREMI